MGLYRLADALDEIVGQFVRHVQPKAAGPAGEPGVDDAALAADELLVGGVVLPHLGQGLEAPPAAVAAGVFGVEVVPAAVGAVGVVVGPALAVAALPVEVEAVRPGVAEHAVQNDADALFLRLPAEQGELLVGAQQGVGVQIVGGVVAVVRVGLEDGVQVDPGDPQLLQIAELFADALKIAAKVVQVQLAALLVGPEVGLALLVGPVDPVGKGHHRVGPALEKAVGENLIHHPASQGLRGGKVRLVDGELPAGARRPAEHRLAQLAPVELAEVGIEVEVVEVKPRLVQRQAQAEVVHPFHAALEIHAVFHGVAAVLGEHQPRLHKAVVLGDGQRQAQGLARPHRSAGGLVGAVKAVEQMVQARSLLWQENVPKVLKMPPGVHRRGHGVHFTGLAPQMLLA